MKYLILAIFLITATAASAQFSMYAQVGANKSFVDVTRTSGIETSKGGYGWQAGIGTEYLTHFGYFVYIGVGARRLQYERDSLAPYFPDTVSKYNYHPLFIDFPIGIGYQFPLKDKKLALKVYGGLDVNVGLTGKVKHTNLYYKLDSAANVPVLQSKETDTRNIRYGKVSKKSYSYDLANSNWGLNVGAGLVLNNSFEVNVFYSQGFTNFLSGRDFAEEINKLSFVEVSLKAYLPNHYIAEHKRKRQAY